MKLLFDENISFRMIKRIEVNFPGSIHCRNITQEVLTDLQIWEYAKNNEFTIVTFDSDFYEWMLLKGYPPKIVWLRMGNSNTDIIANVLNERSRALIEFSKDEELGLIEIY